MTIAPDLDLDAGMPDDPFALPSDAAVSDTYMDRLIEDPSALGRTYARALGEEAGKVRPDVPVEVLIATFAVDMRDGVFARAKGKRRDQGSGLLRQLADQLRHMADDIDRNELDHY